MKLLIGAVLAFLIGAGCRFFDIPAPAPPALQGALLVVAMTFGYILTDKLMAKPAPPAPPAAAAQASLAQPREQPKLQQDRA